jgi:hypothetical protein
LREFFGSFVDALRHRQQQPAALRQRRARPEREGAAGRLDGAVDVSCIAVGDAGAHLPGRWVDLVEAFLRLGIEEPTVQEVLDGPHGWLRSFPEKGERENRLFVRHQPSIHSPEIAATKQGACLNQQSDHGESSWRVS